jgi:hypothetical protein
MSALAAAIGAWILAGAAIQPAQATAIVDPVNFSVVVTYTDYPGGFALCGTESPCASSSGPASGTISLLLPPSDDPDGSPYSGSASATAGGYPAPALSVSAAATAVQLEPDSDEVDPFSFSAGASMTYYFELAQTAGAADSSAIPVLMNGSSSLTVQYSNSDDQTMSSVGMTVTAATPSDDPNTNYSLPAGNNGSFFQTLNILPNVEYTVTMTAFAMTQVAATVDSGPSLTSTASIDPTFTINPADASDFALTFSSGIGNSQSQSAVPEPSTWATMLIGFGSLGAGLRYRRRRAAARARQA